MSQRDYTNGEIGILLHNIHESLKEIKDSQKENKDAIDKNTEYRNKTQGIVSIIKWVGAVNFFSIIGLAIKTLIK